MKKLKLYKSDNREIEINDTYDAAEIMMKDGWRLEPENAPKKRRKRTVEAKDDENSEL